MQRLNGLTFRQLRALEAVAETGSITRAADFEPHPSGGAHAAEDFRREFQLLDV